MVEPAPAGCPAASELGAPPGRLARSTACACAEVAKAAATNIVAAAIRPPDTTRIRRPLHAEGVRRVLFSVVKSMYHTVRAPPAHQLTAVSSIMPLWRKRASSDGSRPRKALKDS